MKALLWLVLSVSLVANTFIGFAVEESGPQIAMSVVAGVLVIGSGVGLWMLREPRETS
ncbi:hypothetical protein OG413_04910 [Streptomyces sp. NBC_01433]|uniref:hypothetical protein n=1 Tax=Streptomyces sp. NBC_01433 TaxID=2903864 RepID=UPI002253E202|nr:hypothetical protein [Streptomyces sp. NBC_01433]MCX4674668.1 hypothetical protein [Streptomyces sp. NBC_01433]